MSRPKKPTRKQKILMSMHRLNTENWLVKGENKEYIEIINRNTKTVRKIAKIEGLR